MSTPAESELDVECEVTQLEGGEVELAVRVAPEQVKPIRERVIKAFARRANIPGFRKGKAPRNIVERYIDGEALKEQIMESLLADAYDAAVEKAGIKPLGRARISEADLEADGGLCFKAAVAPRPEVSLGEYKGVQVTRHITRVTGAEVEAEIERLRGRSAKFAELPPEGVIEKGDLVVVDYEASVEGKKLEEASASGYPLEVGGDELFPELNEAMLGARVGETREITVAYSEDHHDPAFAGKKALFRVVATSARRRQLPELNDEFAKHVSDLDTMEALRERVRENLEAIGRAIADDSVRTELTRKVCETASLDVPDAFVAGAVDRRVDEITGELERRGLYLEQHLRQLGRSFEDWRADLEVEVREDVRRAVVLDEIGTREKIEVTQEEIEAEIHGIAEREGVEEEKVRERLSESGEFNRLATRLYHRKIVQLLLDQAEITEETAEPEPEEGAPSEGEGGGSADTPGNQ